MDPTSGKKMSGDCAPERVEAGLAVLFVFAGILDHEVHRRFRQSIHDRPHDGHCAWGRWRASEKRTAKNSQN